MDFQLAVAGRRPCKVHSTELLLVKPLRWTAFYGLDIHLAL